MSELGKSLLDGYNKLADSVVGWEAEQLSKLLTELLQLTLTNLDILLPLSWMVILFIFKPTRPFAIGSIAIGFLFLLRG